MFEGENSWRPGNCLFTTKPGWWAEEVGENAVAGWVEFRINFINQNIFRVDSIVDFLFDFYDYNLHLNKGSGVVHQRCDSLFNYRRHGKYCNMHWCSVRQGNSAESISGRYWPGHLYFRLGISNFATFSSRLLSHNNYSIYKRMKIFPMFSCLVQ